MLDMVHLQDFTYQQRWKSEPQLPSSGSSTRMIVGENSLSYFLRKSAAVGVQEKKKKRSLQCFMFEHQS